MQEKAIRSKLPFGIVVDLPDNFPTPDGSVDFHVWCSGEDDGTAPGMLRFCVPAALIPKFVEICRETGIKLTIPGDVEFWKPE